MTRLALIIGAPGPPGTPRHLAGVGIDFQNYKQFLLSPSGGAWEEKEIAQLINPTRRGLMTRLRRMRADYTLLIFTGHGGTDRGSGQPFVEINPLRDYVWVSELRTRAARQLVVLDSCRTLVAGLAGLMTEGRRNFPSRLRAAQARQLFDSQLKRCEAGRVICFSCRVGAASADTPGGGLFSNTLFTTTQRWVDGLSPADILPVFYAIRNCWRALAATGQPQAPDIWTSFAGRQHWFPWAVRVPIEMF